MRLALIVSNAQQILANDSQATAIPKAEYNPGTPMDKLLAVCCETKDCVTNDPVLNVKIMQSCPESGTSSCPLSTCDTDDENTFAKLPM